MKHKPSDSYQKIWSTVDKIPKGKVATYGQVARLSELPQHARLVGYALHNLPHGINVPWQRVINSQGRISFSNHSSSYVKQKTLLEREGVTFLKGKVDLKRFGWSR